MTRHGLKLFFGASGLGASSLGAAGGILKIASSAGTLSSTLVMVSFCCRCRLYSALNRERKDDSTDFFVVADRRFDHLLGSTHRAFSFFLDLKVRIRIEIHDLHVAILEADLQLERVGSLELLFAEKFNLMPFALIVDQRPIDVGILLNLFCLRRPT